MNRQNNTKALVESSILTAVAVVLILMCIYLPAFFLIGLFIWPIPITLIYIRHGVKYSILSLVVTYIITAMSSDPVTALGLVMVYGLLGVVLGYCVNSKKATSVTLIIMSSAAFLSTMAVFKLFSLVSGQDVISQGINMLTKSYSTAKSMYLSMGMSKETVDKAMAALPKPEILRMIIPAGFITYSIIVSFICYIFTEKILKRFKHEIPTIKPLSEWYIPSKVSFGIIIIFIVSAIIMNSGMKNGESYFINANIIFDFVFTINAIAWLSWMLKKRNITKVLRWVVVIIAIMPPIGGYIYLVGIFDYILDYRKLDNSRRKPAK